MRKFLLASLLILPLAACKQSDVSSVVSNVEAISKATCGFLPTAATITNIITKAPAASTAEQIAAIVCGAVSQKGAVGLYTAPGVEGYYEGVEIKGEWAK